MIKSAGQRETTEQRIERLFMENCRKWTGYAVRHGIREQDAGDIIQDIMVSLLMKKDSLMLFTDMNLEAYMMETLKNAVKNKLARTRPAEILKEEMLPVVESSEQIVLRNLDFENLKEAVKKLSPDQREIIRMLFYENKKVSQAAQLMGRKEDVIRTYSHRAAAKLRKILEAMDKEGEQDESGKEKTGY